MDAMIERASHTPRSRSSTAHKPAKFIYFLAVERATSISVKQLT